MTITECLGSISFNEIEKSYGMLMEWGTTLPHF